VIVLLMPDSGSLLNAGRYLKNSMAKQFTNAVILRCFIHLFHEIISFPNFPMLLIPTSD
jgi:hypothetical protein